MCTGNTADKPIAKIKLAHHLANLCAMCCLCPQLNADFFLVTNEELTERHQEFQELKKLYDDLR